MGALIYCLCAATALCCAVLLLRAFGQSGYRLLLWSGLCFVGLTVNNLLLVVDKIVIPTAVDLSLARSSVALASVSILVFGLIWDAE